MSEIARRAADVMWADDRASQGLGMRIVEVGDGTATLAMAVREDMTNGHGMAHGGFIFTLADSAFAFACNSSGQRAVASQCQVAYLRPAMLGDTLTARAVERFKEGRQGITDVTITDSSGAVVAEFRGFSRTIPGSLFDTKDETNA
ncbi:hydroxyphenylacetyl-CoA thioesterase PaaI [Acuticoccus mangrovi]|uniref:Hydroxyphenylacetyl-CoA thioesterase PaaI n=1 Tax=Acuticoccus mangrovi TaxID=2796142 RepID=A0A934MJE3_9HYPH|nr:hydroxyphenylacetyl-CoA thioesterase PaaI [Acuticoccus mangrovi]MBJ3778211.1 hydroxyphenylacetyl-CoA thioesterase PaaI [Acuticoccus mangrovi]